MRTTTTILLAALTALGLLASTASAQTGANVAYWRHEEGTNGQQIPAGFDTVVDSTGSGNDMRTFDPTFTSATYTSVVSPLALRSGLPNTLSLDFGPGGDEDRFRAGLDDDNYTEGKPIQQYPFGAMTVQLAFMMDSVALGPDKFQALLGKDGGPLLPASPIPPFKVAVRGDEAEGIPNQLAVEWIDGDGDIHILFSGAPITAGNWNHVAFTLSATNAELWIAGESGPYELVDAISGDDFASEGGNVLIADPTPWTIGRGAFDNGITDWSDAHIDEVLITDGVVTSDQFLFVPGADVPADADFDDDGDVDGQDFLVWQRNLGTTGTATDMAGDANDDQSVTAADFEVWQAQFGGPAPVSAIPEPASLGLALGALLAAAAVTRRACSANK